MAVAQASQRVGLSTPAPTTLRSNEGDSLFTAQDLPPFTEMVRQNAGWSTLAVLAVAGLVVRPSTVAALEIWNGYQPGGPSLIIEDIYTFNLVASAIQGTYTPWAQVTLPKAAPSPGANVTVNGMNGKTYGGPVIVGLGTTVIANGWRLVGGGLPFGLGTATPGGGIMQPQDGKWVVPPQCSLCLHTVSQTTAWTFQNGASWFEKLITNQG